jgi:hypothetical protein
MELCLIRKVEGRRCSGDEDGDGEGVNSAWMRCNRKKFDSFLLLKTWVDIRLLYSWSDSGVLLYD